jgi:hypothetical protein
MSDIQRPRGLTAQILFKQSNRDVIQVLVADQISVIDAKIAVAHQAGFNTIDYELPVNFSINNMDKADAQTLVYSELIKLYSDPEPKGKGFQAYIELNSTPRIHIFWVNGMDDAERKQRNELIRNHLLSRRVGRDGKPIVGHAVRH